MNTNFNSGKMIIEDGMKPCMDCFGELDEQKCDTCGGFGQVPKTEEDLEEEAFDRMLDAADAKYERGLDK